MEFVKKDKIRNITLRLENGQSPPGYCGYHLHPRQQQLIPLSFLQVAFPSFLASF